MFIAIIYKHAFLQILQLGLQETDYQEYAAKESRTQTNCEFVQPVTLGPVFVLTKFNTIRSYWCILNFRLQNC